MTVAPKARFGQAEGAAKRQRASATAVKAVKAVKASKAASPPIAALPAIPTFRTILIPAVGWPTEDSIPGARKRPAKR